MQRRKKEGTTIVPFFFISMAEDKLQQIQTWLEGILTDYPELFLVSIKVKPTNNFKIFIDGDNGFSIDSCTRINRRLYKAIEESLIYPEGEFSLEVSSPGVTEPLKLHRQYTKNIGRDIEIVFNDDTAKIGTLLTVAEEDIIIEHTEGKGKKAIVQQLVIPFTNIKSAIIQIKF